MVLDFQVDEIICFEAGAATAGEKKECISASIGASEIYSIGLEVV